MVYNSCWVMKMDDLLIIEKTEKMKRYLERTKEIFENVRATGKEHDFFKEVKPFVDEAQQFAGEWAKLASRWVDEFQPKNIFPLQIESARDNFNEICPQAFYPKTSLSRFKHHYNSINYILEKLLSEVRNRLDE